MTDNSAGLLKKISVKLSVVNFDIYTVFRLNADMEYNGKIYDKPILSIATHEIDSILECADLWNQKQIEEKLINSCKVEESYPPNTL